MAGTKGATFFWSDWLSDVEVGSCSLAAQGAWMRILCAMATSRDPGKYLVGGKPPQPQDYSKLLGVPTDEAMRLVDEIVDKGVCNRDRRGVLYNRRMIRAEKKAKASAKGGKIGGRVTYEKQTGIFSTQGGTQHPARASHSHSPSNTKNPNTQFYDLDRQGDGGGFSGSGRGGLGGGSGDRCPSMSTDERIRRFSTKLAQHLDRTTRSQQGFNIVASAQDDHHPDHHRALQACKAAAQALGKGWPRNWPTHLRIPT